MNNISEARKAKRDARIIEMYTQGVPVRSIVASAKCSRATVYRVVGKEDMSLRKANKPKQKDYPVRLNSEIKKAIIKDYRDCVKTREILTKYGISRSTLYRILQERHVVEAHSEYTGGGCITYWGKFSDGTFFAFGMGTFAIYDADYGITFTPEFYDLTDGDSYKWEKEHTIESFNHPSRKADPYIQEVMEMLK